MDWFLLPPATIPMIEEVSKAATGRFMGDASHVYENTILKKVGDEDEVEEELVRISAVVMQKPTRIWLSCFIQETLYLWSLWSALCRK